MGGIRIAIVGAGSVRCSPAVIAALATYFGERPIELRMYDADLERLDLFDRFARLCFAMTHNGHNLISTMDVAEALDGADRVLLEVGENCARKYLHESHRMGIANLDAESMIEQAIDEVMGLAPMDAEILSLQRPGIRIPRSHRHAPDWLPEPSAEHRMSVPHQILRWIRGEEYAHELLRQHEKSPLRNWLDDVESLPRIDYTHPRC